MWRSENNVWCEFEYDDEVEERSGEEDETSDANSLADVLVVTENPREETDAIGSQKARAAVTLALSLVERW